MSSNYVNNYQYHFFKRELLLGSIIYVRLAIVLAIRSLIANFD
jgi:hypothetical protein